MDDKQESVAITGGYLPSTASAAMMVMGVSSPWLLRSCVLVHFV